MATEILRIPEENLDEVVTVILRGLEQTYVSEKTRIDYYNDVKR